MKSQLRVVAAILAAGAAIAAGPALAGQAPKGITVAHAEAIVLAAIGQEGTGATVDCIGLDKPKNHTYTKFICHAEGPYIDANFKVKVAGNGKITVKPKK